MAIQPNKTKKQQQHNSLLIIHEKLTVIWIRVVLFWNNEKEVNIHDFG